MKPIITVKNLSKKYQIREKLPYYSLRDSMVNLIKGFSKSNQKKDSFLALKNVSFDVYPGEVMGIIGRNGAGKSTLLKILSQITPPTSGSVTLEGRVASLLEVGTGFHPELTGRENIFLNGAILGMSRKEIKARFDEIVNFAEIEKFLDTPIKHYSSGMYMRLAFAVAAHLESEIFLVDEVLAVGDTQFQKKSLLKIENIAKSGRTVIFVSHNLTAIKDLCKKVLLLKEGRITANGKPLPVINKYLERTRKHIYLREWINNDKAPRNYSTRVLSVCIIDNAGKKLHSISTDTEFNIEIEYYVKIQGSSVGLNLVFYDAEHNCIMGTMNNHERSWYAKPAPIGKYFSRCKIPANLLNNGWYYINLIIFGKNFSDMVIYPNLLKIEVLDGSIVRRDYFGEFGGYFRPLFAWQTQKV